MTKSKIRLLGGLCAYWTGGLQMIILQNVEPTIVNTLAITVGGGLLLALILIVMDRGHDE